MLTDMVALEGIPTGAAQIVCAVGEWEICNPDDFGGWDIDTQGEPNRDAGLVCQVPDDPMGVHRAVVKVEREGVVSPEFHMYETVAGVMAGRWSIRRNNMTTSWWLESRTGELIAYDGAGIVRVSLDMTVAYGIALIYCDDADRDWHKVLVALCQAPKIRTPTSSCELRPDEGNWMIAVLDKLLQEQHAHGEAMIAITKIGDLVRGLLLPKDTTGNPGVLSSLMEERGAVRALTCLVAGSLERIGEALAGCSTWRFPKGHVYSSPVARELLKPLVESDEK